MAMKELMKMRARKDQYATKLYEREEKNPGSVNQNEWKYLEKLKLDCRKQQDEVHRLAPAALAYPLEKHRKMMARRRKRVVELFNQGKSAEEIATELGVSTTTVYKDRKTALAEAQKQTHEPESKPKKTEPSGSSSPANRTSPTKPKPPSKPANRPTPVKPKPPSRPSDKPVQAKAKTSKRPTEKQSEKNSLGYFEVVVLILFVMLLVALF